jgi:energy-coupling factor transporter ATP-binding protein EcfA2
MAKGNGKTAASRNGQEKPQPTYFKSLTIEDVKCFKGKHTIDLSDGNGKPAQWTVILGNNNTGKTTILKCLAGLEAHETFLIIGEKGSTFEEIESGKKPSARFITAAPLLQMNKIGDSYLTPSQGIHEYGIYSQLFASEKMGNSLNSTNFFDLSFPNDGFWGVRYEKDLNKVHFLSGRPELIDALRIISYGAIRRMSADALNDEVQILPHVNLFDQVDLPNMEDWLLRLFLAVKLGNSESAKNILELSKKVLSSGLLPDVREVNLNSKENGVGFVNFVEFLTDFGWIRLQDLGYGYQTMIAWILDLVKRMVERYPDSPNPLAEPAIVLVDEIDLHLHPDWQRKIIAHLTKYFPNTQFIATAHSPLIVQSAEEVNVLILKKEGESVHIEQPKIRSFRGWTVEEILTDLMDLAGQTMSQRYLDLVAQFDDALQDDNYEAAQAAYKELDKILHHDSSGRTLLKLQMSSLSPSHAL